MEMLRKFLDLIDGALLLRAFELEGVGSVWKFRSRFELLIACSNCELPIRFGSNDSGSSAVSLKEEEELKSLEGVELSMNLVVGLFEPRTLCLVGRVHGEDVPVLINWGATRTFISQSVVKKLNLCNYSQLAQNYMKRVEDRHCEEKFQEGISTFLKLLPYRIKFLVRNGNEKLSRGFVGFIRILVWARALISKLTDEKINAVQQNNKLRQELELLRREGSKNRGGVSLWFVIFVGLLGIILGYLMKKS